MDALTAASESQGEGGGGGGGAAAAEGARLTKQALHDALRQHGIEPVAPAVGVTFDVATMEAMLTVPVEQPEQVGTVATLLRPGWLMHGERVLRAAQVGVGAAAEKSE